MKLRTAPPGYPSIARTLAKTLALTGVLACGFALVPQARAGVLQYSFTQYTGSGTPTASPYGTVTLTSSGANVTVSVALAGTEGFVDTRAGHSLMWEMHNSPLTITGLTSGFSVVGGSYSTGNDAWTVSTANNTLHGGGNGYWDYAVTCAGGACAQGGSGPFVGTLRFTVDNVSLSDFIANGYQPTPFFFASDICTEVDATTHQCTKGITGDIAAPGPGSSVPEPGTLALFAGGLLGCGLFIARRRRAEQG